MPQIQFRKEALSRLTSPDRLDEPLQVRPGLSWLFLLGGWLVLLVLLGWSFFGQVPVEIEAQGVVLLKGHLTLAAASKAGQLREVYVKVGQTVHKGDPLVQLDDTIVRADTDGIVIEIEAIPIEPVVSGQPLVLLSPLGSVRDDLMASGFVSAKEGSSIRVGMPVEIGIESAQVERNGRLLGRVAYVSPYPFSTEAIASTLKIRSLAQRVERAVGLAPYYVVIEPEKDAQGQMRWSGIAPNTPIALGTWFVARVTVDQNRPIDYLLPWFERIL